MIVVDASVLVDFLLGLPPHYEEIRDRIRGDARGLAAPHLVDVEVGQVLRRLVRTRAIDLATAEEAIRHLLALGLLRYAHAPLLPRAFELRNSVTMYDGLYLALAEALGAPLLTRDAALSKSVGSRARVDVLA